MITDVQTDAWTLGQTADHKQIASGGIKICTHKNIKKSRGCVLLFYVYSVHLYKEPIISCWQLQKDLMVSHSHLLPSLIISTITSRNTCQCFSRYEKSSDGCITWCQM